MRNKLLDLVRNGVRCPETAKTCQDCQYHSTRHPMHCDEEAALVDLLIANGVVIPVRCKDCGWWHRHKSGDLSRGVCDKYAMSKSENGYCDEPLLEERKLPWEK